MTKLRLRRWRRSSIVAGVVTLGLTFGPAPQAAATHVPGGGSKKADCYSEFDTQGDTITGVVVQCTDGSSCDSDGAANGACVFTVALCVNQTDVSGCTPMPPLTKVKVTPRGILTPPADLSGATCGANASITVPLKGRKKNHPGKKIIHVVAKSSGKPKVDTDKLVLKCNPPHGSTTTTTMQFCVANPQGGPDEADFSTADSGTDLDNGWTGISHNFPVDPRASLKVCLSGCDASTNPVCDLMGAVGAGSINGATFGPPLPLIAQGVAVCVINRFQTTPVTGKLNVQTGEVSDTTPIQVNLFSDVHLISDHTNVCPRCSTGSAPQYGASGTCSAGPNRGKRCTVESIVTVAESQGSPTYGLSAACPPDPAAKAATLDIRLALTSGTSTLPGPKPCGESADDNCGATPCAATCTGAACVSHDASGNCIDSKGGISQLCCNGSTSTPCYPTAGGGAIVRTGKPDPPAPVWPDPTYPKTTTGGILVTTFCEAATGVGTIDNVTGLPGPGALILPGKQTLLKR